MTCSSCLALRYGFPCEKTRAFTLSAAPIGLRHLVLTPANRNSENVVVIWNDPALAAKYLAHWESRFKAGAEYAHR